jgi:hypothetical protein
MMARPAQPITVTTAEPRVAHSAISQGDNSAPLHSIE